jgi:hypothetical protein
MVPAAWSKPTPIPAAVNPTDISYDTCTGNDRHRTSGNGPVHLTHFETLPSGDYLMSELDEVGRLTQTTYDRLHRALSVRQYTGFATPGVLPVSFPLSGKIRPGDPDFFETTFAYNNDHLCTRVTHPDGTQETITHDRELRRDCPVIERGNPRVFTLTTALGELRTVTCDYLPGFGTTESARPGNPIRIRKGVDISRNPGGDVSPQNRSGGWTRIKNKTPLSVCRVSGASGVSWSGSDGDDVPEEIFQNLLSPPTPTFLDDDCDGDDISALVVFLSKKGYDYYKAQSDHSFVSRVRTSHGETFAWSHNERGDIVSRTSPIPGQGTLFEYDPDGQCTSVTELNGAGESMQVTLAIRRPGGGGITGSTRRRSGAPSLTTTFDRDDLNRITRITDPLSQQWLIEYSPEGLCTQVSSPPVPAPIRLQLAYDSAGELARCDLDHLDATGSPVAENPSYSTFMVRNNRGRLIRIARKNARSMAPPPSIPPPSALKISAPPTLPMMPPGPASPSAPPPLAVPRRPTPSLPSCSTSAACSTAVSKADSEIPTLSPLSMTTTRVAPSPASLRLPLAFPARKLSTPTMASCGFPP